jgi:hypothetical protein
VEYVLGTNQDLHLTISVGKFSRTVLFDMHKVLKQTMELQQPSKPEKLSGNGLKPDIDVRVKCWNIQSDEQLSKIKFYCKIVWTEEKSNKDKLFFLKLSELVMGKTAPMGLP